MSESKKFDLDKFIESLEHESDGVFADDDARFAECPRCGSDSWDELIYGKNGKIVKCTDCRGDHEN